MIHHGKKRLDGIILYLNEEWKTMIPSLLLFKIFLLWELSFSQPPVRKIGKLFKTENYFKIRGKNLRRSQQTQIQFNGIRIFQQRVFMSISVFHANQPCHKRMKLQTKLKSGPLKWTHFFIWAETVVHCCHKSLEKPQIRDGW